MKNKLNSFILFLLLGILFFPSFAKAVSILPEQELVCDTRQMFEEICYQGNLISIPYTVTYIEEIEYPIYCENQEKAGSSLALSYMVQTQNSLQNIKIQEIMKLGYPNCSLESLGCWSPLEAYAITQIAIFDTYYHYDLTKFTVKENANISEEFISNMIAFIQKCRKLNSEQVYPEITIDERNIQWKEENENYYSKTYEIKSNMQVEKYYIEVLGVSENEVLILNEQNEEEKQFQKKEKFKILIPKEKNISFQIQVKAKVTLPTILIGKPYYPEYREYFFFSDTRVLSEKLVQEYFAESEVKDNIGNNPIEKEENSQITSYQVIKTQKKEKKILPQTGM